MIVHALVNSNADNDEYDALDLENTLPHINKDVHICHAEESLQGCDAESREVNGKVVDNFFLEGVSQKGWRGVTKDNGNDDRVSSELTKDDFIKKEE